MADQSDHQSPVGGWNYYQFMFRGNEVVVVNGAECQRAFSVDANGALWPLPHKCIVNALASTTQGYFALEINGKTQIRMRRHPSDGICRGTIDHWKGNWTPVSKTSLQMAYQGVVFPAPTPVARPWGEVARAANAAPAWGSTPDGLIRDHPSGRHAHELEECSACSGGGHSGLPGGMCSDCYGTGQMPKQQKESTTMNMQEMISVMQIQQGAKVVAAKYFTNNQAGFSAAAYHFKNVLGITLVSGDLAVVQTKGQYALVTIVDPDVRANAVEVPLGELQHIACKVDLANLKIVTEAENSAMHALALSEVTERLGKFKEQVGESTFNTMQGLLAPPATKE
jgi:hypothetical protein